MATGGAGAEAAEPGSVRTAPGRPRLIPGAPVQGHCSMLTMSDGDESQRNKAWLHTHTYCYWQLPAFLGMLFMEAWTAVVSAGQWHLAVGILQRLSVEFLPCRNQNQTTLWMGEGNKWVGKTVQGGQNNRGPVATITGFPPYFPCCM